MWLADDLKAGVPRNHLGRDPFSYDKVVKFILRVGLNIYEVDMENSHFNRLWDSLDPRDHCMFSSAFKEYLASREEVLQNTGAYLSTKLGLELDRDDVKEVFLALGNLKTLYRVIEGLQKKHG